MIALIAAHSEQRITCGTSKFNNCDSGLGGRGGYGITFCCSLQQRQSLPVTCMKHSPPPFSRFPISRSFDDRSFPLMGRVVPRARRRQPGSSAPRSLAAGSRCPVSCGQPPQPNPRLCTLPRPRRRGRRLLASLVCEMAAAAILWRDLQLSAASGGVRLSVGKVSRKSEDTQCLYLLWVYLYTHTGVFRGLDLLLDFK